MAKIRWDSLHGLAVHGPPVLVFLLASGLAWFGRHVHTHKFASFHIHILIHRPTALANKHTRLILTFIVVVTVFIA